MIARLPSLASGLALAVALSIGGSIVFASTPASIAEGPGAALGWDDARHLLARTGFGPTDAEILTYATLTRADAVAKLLAATRTVAVTPPPAAMSEESGLPRGGLANATAEERKAFQQQQIREGLAIRGWWMREMLATPSPLTERMTLFWHNHFVSSQPKVRFARLMYRQNVTLRAGALGDFGKLLHAIARDPAMVIYLDNAQNRKGAPNENFAREVMELFTLGEGHYTEQDIKEAARAFTGWSIDRETGTFRFRPALHDYGSKTVFGKTGNFDGDDVLDLLLARPETAEFIVAKLWREFVSPEPDRAAVVRIAARFRESHYDLKVALAAILEGDAFYAPGNRGVLVKSPVELVVGTLRQLELAPETALPFAIAAATMGQNLLSPPNVKGWPGGEAWINSTTLLARKQFLDRVTRGGDSAREPSAMAMAEDAEAEPTMREAPAADAPAVTVAKAGDDSAEKARARRFRREMERGVAKLGFDGAQWMARLPGETAADRARRAQRLLLAAAADQSPHDDSDATSFVHGLVQDAAYQLK